MAGNEFSEERFAVIADIHGNADALTAVLDDIARQSIQSIVNLGDHFSSPLAVRETAEILLSREMVSIRGNHDRWLIEQKPGEMDILDRIAYEQLEERHLDWLRGLPSTLALNPEIFLCHGTPSSDMIYWLDLVKPDSDVVLRDLDSVAAAANGIGATLFLCGHTHIPRRVDLPGGAVILNPGSVGCPAYRDVLPWPHMMQTGTSAACYAIVEKSANGWVTAIRHVPYDYSRMVALARENKLDHWEIRLSMGRVG